MKQLFPLFGIVTVLNTPFTENDTIDFSGLKNNIDRAIRADVAGFLVPAMASEVYKLSTRERLDLVDTVLDQVNGRVPVIAGAGESDATKRKKMVNDLLALGCKNILLQIPFMSTEQFRSDFHNIAQFDIEMIMLQDWDDRGYGLPVELLCRLFDEIDAFRCLKIEVVPAGIKYSEILRATNGLLNVSGGWAVSQIMEGLQRGIHAFMPTAMHELYTTIYKLYKSGQTHKAENIFYKVLPVLAFANQHLDISIHFFKRLLHRQGIYATSKVRQPILPFDEIHEAIAQQLIEYVIALIEEVKGKY